MSTKTPSQITNVQAEVLDHALEMHERWYRDCKLDDRDADTIAGQRRAANFNLHKLTIDERRLMQEALENWMDYCGDMHLDAFNKGDRDGSLRWGAELGVAETLLR